MSYFNIDFNQFRPSSAVKTPQPIGVVPTPSSIVKPVATVTPQVQNQPAPVSQTNQGVIDKVFNLLTVPSYSLGGFLQGARTDAEKRTAELKAAGQKPSVVDIFNTFKAGVQNIPSGIRNKISPSKAYSQFSPTDPISSGLRNFNQNSVGGLATDIVVDPLNLAGAGAGKLLTKIPGVSKIAEAVPKVTENIKKIPLPSLGIEDRVFKPGLTTVGNILDNLGQKFIKGYGLPGEYNVMKSEIPTKVSLGVKDILERTQRQFKDLPNQVVEAIPKFLEPNTKVNKAGEVISGAGTGTDLAKLRQELGDEMFNKIKPVLHEIRQQFDSDIVDLVKRGRLKGEEAKVLLNQGGYYPHTDFATKTLKDFFVKPKMGEKRIYTEARKGLEGFTFNAPKAIARREFMQFQDNVLQDFLKEVKTQFGVQVGKGKSVPEGFFPFLDNTSNRLQELKGWALPTKIANDLNASIQTGGEIGKAIDTFNLFWKPTATAMNPAFHIMNVMGNLYNSWLGGMKDPRRFLQAADPRALFSGLTSFTPEEKTILEKTGVLSRGQFAGDVIKRTFDNPEGIDTLKLFDRFRTVGENFENNARAAFFLDQRNKFLGQGLSDVESTRQALQQVNKYLFDYLTGLTPFEGNIMRRIFPFYTWARFNIPLQLKSLVTMPEKNAVVAKVNRFFNPQGKPEGDQPGITFPTPFKDAQGNPVRYKPNLPVQDIFDMLSRPLSMLNPIFKDVPQLAYWVGSTMAGNPVAPMDLFTGQPRTNVNLPFSEQVKDVTGSILKSTLRPVRSVAKMTEGNLSPSAIMRQFMGGTYTIPTEYLQIQKGGRRQLINRAIMEKAGKINRDKSLTIEQRRKKVEDLLRLRQ